MAEVQEESLKCYIHRFGVSLDLKNIRRIQLCYNQRFLSIEKHDSSLEVIKIDTKQDNTNIVEDVEQWVCFSFVFYHHITYLSSLTLSA